MQFLTQHQVYLIQKPTYNH